MESTAERGTLKILNIPCRYYRVYTDPDVSCDEQNFGFVERDLSIPIEQAALVLVDVWSTHYIDSWLQRATEVTRERIVPLLQAARRAGVTVIHAPSPFVVERHHPEFTPTSGSSAEPSAWPPPAFRGIYRSGEHADFGRDREPRLQEAISRYETELKISDLVAPLPGEPIIATGNQLHELLTERRILHLVYAGFATNWCVIGRDYGIIAMNERGYNIVLVRDATTGVEFHDSVEELTATEIAIREVETKYAWSTTTDAFITSAV
ncbi:MAG: isochorismatase family protein [Gemmatimonadetes bacterium]|nr:isochorismatase family protein [Gemmatimonadota bacterium]